MTTNGTIKRMTNKGFRFIATAEGTEYFFHQSACAGTPFDDLREGQTVSFTVGQSPKGPRPSTSTCGDRRHRAAADRCTR
jgi:CspA family cold shock protein